MSEPKAKRIKIDGFRGDDWPDLIWIKIFDHFNFEERQTLKLLSSRYYYLLNSLRYNKKATLVLENCVISPLCPPWTIFEKSELIIRKIVIGKNIWMHRSCRLWKSIESSVETIILESGELHMKKFNQFISNFESLKEIYLPSMKQAYELRSSKELEKLHIKEVKSSINAELKNLRNEQKNTMVFETFCKNVTTNCVEQEMKIRKLMFQEELNIFNLPAFDLSGVIAIQDRRYHPSILKKYPNFQKLGLMTNGHYEDLLSYETLKVKEASFSVSGFIKKTHLQNISNKLPNLVSVKIDLNSSANHLKPQQLLDILPKSVKYLQFWPPEKKKLEIDLPLLEDLSCLYSSAFLNKKNSNKFVALKKLKLLSFYEKVDFTKLLLFFPNLQEIRIYNQLTVQQFRTIEESWPNLKKLEAKFQNEAKEIVTAIEGRFKCLKVLDYCHSSVNDAVEDFHMQAFDKVPTIRQLFGVSYKNYCLKKFNVIRSARKQ